MGRLAGSRPAPARASPWMPEPPAAPATCCCCRCWCTSLASVRTAPGACQQTCSTPCSASLPATQHGGVAALLPPPLCFAPALALGSGCWAQQRYSCSSPATGLPPQASAQTLAPLLEADSPVGGGLEAPASATVAAVVPLLRSRLVATRATSSFCCGEAAQGQQRVSGVALPLSGRSSRRASWHRAHWQPLVGHSAAAAAPPPLPLPPPLPQLARAC